MSTLGDMLGSTKRLIRGVGGSPIVPISSREKSKTYPAGRECAETECDTILSIYNSERYCGGCRTAALVREDQRKIAKMKASKLKASREQSKKRSEELKLKKSE